MAIANSDGSIVLSTKVDEGGLKAWFASVNLQSKATQANIKGIGTSAKAASTQAKTAIAGIGTALKSLMSYFIGIQTILASIRFSGAAARFATQTEASVQRLVDIYGSASESVGNFIDQNARALGMSKSAAASFSSVYGNLFSAFADQETNAALTNEYLQMTAVVASKTGRTVEDVQERIRSGLLGNTEAIEDLGVFVNVKTIEMTDAFQRMADGKSWEQLDAYTQQQVRSMAILEQATDKYGNEVAETSATIRNQFNAAYQDFQNSWGNIINTVLLPVLQVLTQVMNIATAGLNALSGRSGKILEGANGIQSASDKTADNINEQTKNQKALNKEIKKGLAGFDEINTLSSETEENTSSGDLGGGLQGVAGGLGGNLDGSVRSDEIDSTLTAIMGVVGIALAALGCVLLFTGHIGWGLGFIIAGAGVFGVTAATLGDDAISQETKNALSNALIIVGIVAIVLGILLCMASQWGIGIGLIALGVTSIVTPIALNWDGIKQQLQTSFGGWLALGGLIAIVLGILLCFTPMLPLGIGLIVLGVGAVVAPIVANWDAITERLHNFFTENAGLITGASIGLIILGILLCFTPMIGLGIGLIVAGAAGIAGVVAVNWNAIVDWVKKAWEAVKGFWNKYIAPVFTAKFWLDLAKTCGNGLIAGFEGAINGIIWLFESLINLVVSGLNLFIKGISTVTGAVGDLIGVDLRIPEIPKASLGRVKLPRLAQGAVIPPNKEFLAVLGDQKSGTNIEAPLDTIKQAVAEVLAGMRTTSGFNGRIEVPVVINGREIARAVREAEEDLGTQTVFGGFARVY